MAYGEPMCTGHVLMPRATTPGPPPVVDRARSTELRWFTAAEPDSVERRNGPPPRGSVVKVTAVRIRYEHIAAGWRRATGERRAGLLGELELLALQLPAVVVVQPDDPDRAEVIALRAAISQLITEITVGLADPA